MPCTLSNARPWRSDIFRHGSDLSRRRSRTLLMQIILATTHQAVRVDDAAQGRRDNASSSIRWICAPMYMAPIGSPKVPTVGGPRRAPPASRAPSAPTARHWRRLRNPSSTRRAATSHPASPRPGTDSPTAPARRPAGAVDHRIEGLCCACRRPGGGPGHGDPATLAAADTDCSRAAMKRMRPSPSPVVDDRLVLRRRAETVHVVPGARLPAERGASPAPAARPEAPHRVAQVVEGLVPHAAAASTRAISARSARSQPAPWPTRRRRSGTPAAGPRCGPEARRPAARPARQAAGLGQHRRHRGLRSWGAGRAAKPQDLRRGVARRTSVDSTSSAGQDPAADEQHARVRPGPAQAWRVERVLDHRRCAASAGSNGRCSRGSGLPVAMNSSSAGSVCPPAVVTCSAWPDGDSSMARSRRSRDRRTGRRPQRVRLQRLLDVAAEFGAADVQGAIRPQRLRVAFELAAGVAPAAEVPGIVGQQRVHVARGVETMVGVGGVVGKAAPRPLGRIDDRDGQRHAAAPHQAGPRRWRR